MYQGLVLSAIQLSEDAVCIYDVFDVIDLFEFFNTSDIKLDSEVWHNATI